LTELDVALAVDAVERAEGAGDLVDLEVHTALLAAERVVLAVDGGEATLLLVRHACLEGENVGAALAVLHPVPLLLAPGEVILTEDLEITNVSLHKEAAREDLFGEAAAARWALGILGNAFRDARQTEEMPVLALTRLVEDLEADRALELLRGLLIDYQVLDLETGLGERERTRLLFLFQHRQRTAQRSSSSSSTIWGGRQGRR